MKRIFLAIFIVIFFLVIVALSLKLNKNKKYIYELEIHEKNYMTCNEYQANMTNYVIEHYNDILNYSEKVSADFDRVTYKDQFGRAVMDKDTYAALLNEYNLNYFSDNSSYIEFYEDKVHFVHNVIYFENGYYAYFYFVFENGKITVCPYEYDLLYQGC